MSDQQAIKAKKQKHRHAGELWDEVPNTAALTRALAKQTQRAYVLSTKSYFVANEKGDWMAKR